VLAAFNFGINMGKAVSSLYPGLMVNQAQDKKKKVINVPTHHFVSVFSLHADTHQALADTLVFPGFISAAYRGPSHNLCQLGQASAKPISVHGSEHHHRSTQYFLADSPLTEVATEHLIDCTELSCS